MDTSPPIVRMRDSLLLTDLYQLNMAQAYLDAGMTGTAVFEFFVRRLPSERGFLMAAGLEQVLGFLENARFTATELQWLADRGIFSGDLIDYLKDFRFTGDAHAMPEGTVFFQDEPILRITAPLPEAQLLETHIINRLHFQTVIASKAARMVLAAPGKTLIDFGLRRAHGADAGLLAARAAYLAGFTGTATTLAAPIFDIPIFGTMAHSFIQAHDDEAEAFENFARSRPDSVVLLLDTYDTAAAARKIVALAPRLAEAGINVHGVRLDSGDLDEEARLTREILDDAGLRDIKIFASGGIDEAALQDFVADAAPIDGYGIGTSLTTSSDAPALDCAYKLQEYDGRPRRKISVGKATWPGRKEVYRRYDEDGVMTGDILTIDEDRQEGEPLIRQVMRAGRRIAPAATLDEIRRHAADQLTRLPAGQRRLADGVAYDVTVAPALRELAAETDRARCHTGRRPVGESETV